MPESESITPYLEENGPTPRSELPVRLESYHREQGVWLFRLTSGVGDTQPAGGQSVKIAYLPEHKKEDVCRCFFEANPEFVDAQTYRSASRQLSNYGREWIDACRPVIAEFFESPSASDESGFDTGETETCSFCGEPVPKGGLPAHLQECSER
ncbi:hypothetical protein [Salinirubrum litoreum]|uniref:Uncharacterized protein n=1 Tax=Salinirubrum litoreum TaxID=1126234 RepID=A0ABD5RB40_9EURY|nr:hypothetical protein [Salinirubrum litoreum]